MKATAESSRDRTYPFIHKAEELLTLIRTTGGTHVGLALDTWNWKVGAGGMEHLSDLKGQQSVTVTIADVPADADLEKIDAAQRFLPTEETIPAYAQFVASLAERKYDGPVTLLVRLAARVGDDPRLQHRQMRLLLEQIWSQAGLSKPGRLALSAAEFAK